MSDFLDNGKIQQGFFKEMIFPWCGAARPEVMAGPQYGVDVALVSLPGGMAMALTSDPLSLIPTLGLRESAWLSVQLMANDMATTGVAPMYAQLVLNLPPDTTAQMFEEYWQYIHSYCNNINVAITGGHTARVQGQHSTIAGGGTMVAVAPQEQFLLSKYAQPGDVILVTKECALVAASILAMSFPQTVKDKCGTENWQAACDLFYKTSSLQDGLTAVQAGEKSVTAMHDVTEGGVLGAIYEMMTAAGCGAYIYSKLLPVGEPQQNVCSLFDIDPRYCVGAGSMIITAKADQKERVIQELMENGISASEVGIVTEKEHGLIINENGMENPLVHPGVDSYWHAFFNALGKGWK